MRDFEQNWKLGRRDNGLARYSRGGVAPSIIADFANGAFGLGEKRLSFEEVVTHSRNSPGSFVSADGQLQTDAAGPRFDHDPASGNALGLLIEEQRTNLFYPSEDAVQWPMSPPNGFAVQNNAEDAPDGTAAAGTLVPSADLGLHISYMMFPGAVDTTYCQSMFIKPMGDCSYVQLNLGSSGFPASGWVTFDLGNGVVSSSGADVDAAGIVPCGDGWYRIWLAATSDSNGGAYVAGIYAMNSGANLSFAGDGTSGYVVWGRQIEVGASPSSYCRTETGAAVRQGDTCFVDGASFSENFNASEGTVFAEFVIPSLGSDTMHLLHLGDGTADNCIRLDLLPTGDVAIVIISGGVTQATVIGGSYQPGTLCKVAAAFSASGISIGLNGALVADVTTVSMPVGLQRMAVGHAEWGAGNHINGTVGRALYFKEKLSNSVVQSLSS